MNALQIAQLIRQECGIAGSGAPASIVDQTGEMKRVVDWMIQADLYIQMLHTDWKFLWKEYAFNTIVGQTDYAKPADITDWDRESFWLDSTTNNAVDLKYMDWYEWREFHRAGVKTNHIPDRIIIKPDNSLVLDSPPNDVYSCTAEYFANPVAMAANDDVPPYPATYYRIIVARAKRMYAAYEDAPEIMQEAQDEYNYLLPRLESAQVPGQENQFNNSGNAQMVVEAE